MPIYHPLFAEDRPLIIAHRWGNTLELAKRAHEFGADMIETDVWGYRNRLEIRHLKTAGRLPILWDRWELHRGWGPRFQLKELAEGLPLDARLFLDLKGNDLSLAPKIVKTLRELQPEREIILCGRNWAQLDAVRGDPNVTLFYSVGSDEELASVEKKLDGMAHPAISIHCRYLDEATVKRFKDRDTTIVTWPVNTFDLAVTLHQRGVDGFTTDSTELIEKVAKLRDKALLPSPNRSVS